MEMDGMLILMHICITTAAFFKLATFIVYCVIPELKNFHGRIVRRYLASYLGCAISLQSFILSEPSEPIQSCFIVVTGYFGAACLLWLNVMSFDLWRSFRNLPSGGSENFKNREKVQLVRYSIYAWGGSFLVFLSTIAILYYPGDTRQQILPFALGVGLLMVVGIAICNTLLYIWTVLTMKKSTTDAENRFILYLKLFIIMRVSLIAWALPILYRIGGGSMNTYDIISLFLSAIEVLQGFFLFLIFVWKDDVKESFRKQFYAMLHWLRSLFRRKSTLVIENANEEWVSRF